MVRLVPLLRTYARLRAIVVVDAASISGSFATHCYSSPLRGRKKATIGESSVGNTGRPLMSSADMLGVEPASQSVIHAVAERHSLA